MAKLSLPQLERHLFAAVCHYGADRGIVVTTGKFTQSARELANSNDVELVDGLGLHELISKYG